VPIALKSGSLKVLEPSGPVKTCNWTALPLPADCEQDLDIPDDITAYPLFEVLQKCQQKLILISRRQEDSGFQEKLRNIHKCFEDN
jgi:hypothetical protein